MRSIVEPPPSALCDRCGGQLSLKSVDPAHSIFGSRRNVFVCGGCGQVRSFVVRTDLGDSRPGSAGSGRIS